MLEKYINLLFVLFIAVAFTACAPGGRAGIDRPAAPNVLNQDNEEEEEYELIIIDPGFNTWFMTRAQPMNFYSHDFYRQWNYQYVVAWNQMVDQQVNYNHPYYPFENRIDYSPHINYGLALDYQLFWYFQYVHSRFGGLYNFPGFRVRSF